MEMVEDGESGTHWSRRGESVRPAHTELSLPGQGSSNTSPNHTLSVLCRPEAAATKIMKRSGLRSEKGARDRIPSRRTQYPCSIRSLTFLRADWISRNLVSTLVSGIYGNNPIVRLWLGIYSALWSWPVFRTSSGCQVETFYKANLSWVEVL